MKRAIKLLRSIALRWPIARRAKCAVCGHAVGGFLPYKQGWAAAPRVLRRLSVEGSDLDNFECPRCGAHDRERHLVLYLRSHPLWAELSTLRILHAAPEKRLAVLISSLRPRQHLQCDLHPSGKDVQRVDLHSIPAPDASFDLVIANHVLEHVADVDKVLAEIGRVLVPGGHAILQTPFARGLEVTLEDVAVDSNLKRLEAYGQEDHLRLFGRDVFKRIETGMNATMAGGSHVELLPDVDPAEAGVNPGEPFMLFQKTVAAESRIPSADWASPSSG